MMRNQLDLQQLNNPNNAGRPAEDAVGRQPYAPIYRNQMSGCYPGVSLVIPYGYSQPAVVPSRATEPQARPSAPLSSPSRDANMHYLTSGDAPREAQSAAYLPMSGYGEVPPRAATAAPCDAAHLGLSHESDGEYVKVRPQFLQMLMQQQAPHTPALSPPQDASRVPYGLPMGYQGGGSGSHGASPPPVWQPSRGTRNSSAAFRAASTSPSMSPSSYPAVNSAPFSLPEAGTYLGSSTPYPYHTAPPDVAANVHSLDNASVTQPAMRVPPAMRPGAGRRPKPTASSGSSHGASMHGGLEERGAAKPSTTSRTAEKTANNGERFVIGEWYEGVVKRYNPLRGFGFATGLYHLRYNARDCEACCTTHAEDMPLTDPAAKEAAEAKSTEASSSPAATAGEASSQPTVAQTREARLSELERTHQGTSVLSTMQWYLDKLSKADQLARVPAELGDIFIHHSCISLEGFRVLPIGTAVRFCVAVIMNTVQAVDVVPLGEDWNQTEADLPPTVAAESTLPPCTVSPSALTVLQYHKTAAAARSAPIRWDDVCVLPSAAVPNALLGKSELQVVRVPAASAVEDHDESSFASVSVAKPHKEGLAKSGGEAPMAARLASAKPVGRSLEEDSSVHEARPNGSNTGEDTQTTSAGLTSDPNRHSSQDAGATTHASGGSRSANAVVGLGSLCSRPNNGSAPTRPTSGTTMSMPHFRGSSVPTGSGVQSGDSAGYAKRTRRARRASAPKPAPTNGHNHDTSASSGLETSSARPPRPSHAHEGSPSGDSSAHRGGRGSSDDSREHGGDTSTHNSGSTLPETKVSNPDADVDWADVFRRKMANERVKDVALNKNDLKHFPHHTAEGAANAAAAAAQRTAHANANLMNSTSGNHIPAITGAAPQALPLSAVGELDSSSSRGIDEDEDDDEEDDAVKTPKEKLARTAGAPVISAGSAELPTTELSSGEQPTQTSSGMQPITPPSERVNSLRSSNKPIKPHTPMTQSKPKKPKAKNLPDLVLVAVKQLPASLQQQVPGGAPFIALPRATLVELGLSPPTRDERQATSRRHARAGSAQSSSPAAGSMKQSASDAKPKSESIRWWCPDGDTDATSSDFSGQVPTYFVFSHSQPNTNCPSVLSGGTAAARGAASPSSKAPEGQTAPSEEPNTSSSESNHTGATSGSKSQRIIFYPHLANPRSHTALPSRRGEKEWLCEMPKEGDGPLQPAERDTPKETTPDCTPTEFDRAPGTQNVTSS